ncbi:MULTISPECIES: cysteine desulfurase family protein [unclassified Methanoregula]|uniref:cysteine desulfurase family protein n=1 Tax=unclassified Methanoregula TaxID=2649730 RepID=UPI0009D02DC0|nr:MULTISPECIES: cysteine desulfurase family protein [unclassified Methanoregula]OPX62562.1 MAG: putative cysteine desulfurase 2 [Methanoregula sp. PtaB.Bin085]OPY31661.1 MAG: putative cysteine desulfurase 2 [Methanoregula sp. PtaU1.Bin006]
MENKRPIYMDHHATTPVDPRVLEAMLPYFSDTFGNAGSIDHVYGAVAADAVKKAREQCAHILNTSADEIIFTSGATESDNIAILGVADQYAAKGDHIITCVTEHKAVLDTCKHLQKTGKTVTFLPVDKYGLVDPGAVEAAITDKTVLISIMTANNEIGTIAPIKEIGKIAHDHCVIFHTDAAQAVGHIPMDVEAMNIDLLSFSGHKIYGPKGIGGLYVRRRNPKVKVSPVMFGGGQEKGLRSGTLNVPGIVGLGKALAIAEKEMGRDEKQYQQWTSLMYNSFMDAVPDVMLNGHPTKRLAHNLNVCFPGIESKALINLLKNDIAFSAGSACTTTSVEPSHVLLAIGRSEEESHWAVRFGLGRGNGEEEIRECIIKTIQKIQKLELIKSAL